VTPSITHLDPLGCGRSPGGALSGHSKVSTTLDLYVGEFEKRKANDSGQRLAEIFAGALT
jgi:hypothetical protein